MLNKALLKCKPYEDQVLPVLVYLGIGVGQGKNPKKGHGCIEKDP